MARQIYFRGQAQQPSVNIPQVHGATSVPQFRSEGAEILKGLADLSKAATQAYIRWDDKRQQSLIEDAFLKARGEMSKWSAEYQRTNQGADALEAQAAFEQQWGRISQGIQSAYKDRLSDGAMHYLGRKMELGRLYALDDGARYQTQQTAAWNKNQEQVRLSQMGEDVANDPYNFARHQMNVNEAVSAWERANPGMDSSAYRRKLEQGVFEGIFNGMVAREDYDGAERVLNWGANGAGGQRQSTGEVTGGAGLYGAVTHTGRHRVLAYHESGTEGSQHVSYGLPQTDGVDVGKYSFITKGGNGGSAGDFIRWAGTQGGVGKSCTTRCMHSWKEKAAAIWKEVAKSDPKAFETLEDNFMQARFDKVISTLRPEVQEAIRNDKTGALYEMAASTINQHATAKTILNRNFDADPEAYVRKVYQDRSDPKRFARTSDPSMGARRMKAEIQDVLGILRGQATGQAVAQAGAEQSTANQSGVTGSYGESVATPQGSGTPSSIFDPAKALTMRKALDAGRKKQRIDNFLNEYSENPQEGISVLATSEGRARYGVSGKEAEEVSNLLYTRINHMKKAEKQQREEYERDIFTSAADLALGVGGKSADPVSALRMVQESNLDGKTKLEVLKAIREGTLDQDDPSYITDVQTRIAANEPVTDEELARAIATGRLSFKTKDRLLKLRDLADGPQGEIIKSAFNAINDAYKKSMMADGTPEQAQAHYAALHELQMAIDDAKEKGTIREVLDPASPKYILPGIMQRHQLSMQDQVRAMQNKVTGEGSIPQRKPGESIQEYQKRMSGENK